LSVPSFGFLAFALLAAFAVNAFQNRAWRELIMLLANIAFLASFATNLWSVLPLTAFVLIGYALFLIELRQRRDLFWIGVAFVLVLFFWLKKYSFIPAGLFIGTPYIAIGISYIFFRILHLMIDAGQGAIARKLNIVEYLNYVLNFPCIVAGPIQMYPDYAQGRLGRPRARVLGRGIERVIVGMVKVLVVSAALDLVQHEVRATILNGDHSLWRQAALIALYPMFLFFNFSGYTDVVIGVGLWLGQELPENFDRPFLSTSFIEFWSRWHMSLSHWLRTYVYNPLLMNGMSRFRSSAAATAISILAFFVTFFLVGLWHGQTWNFVIFGILQGGGVAVNKAYQVLMAGWLGARSYRALAAKGLYRTLSRGLTFTWFAFTLLWFWNDALQLHQLFQVLGRSGVAGALCLVFAGSTPALVVLATALRAWDRPSALRRLVSSPYVRTVVATALAYGLILVEFAISAPPPAVVYKAF
jgi:D-alanyl-lipoteichoic acid acyltransferase DltB (MBOAT superfamily)